MRNLAQCQDRHFSEENGSEQEGSDRGPRASPATGACILRFATEGKGTLSPLDPTKKLVIRGLYKYSRNPMYVGVMLILSGETLFYWSPALAIYAVIVLVAFNLFIFLHEEPRCRRDFGNEYAEYCRRVGRWF